MKEQVSFNNYYILTDSLASVRQFDNDIFMHHLKKRYKIKLFSRFSKEQLTDSPYVPRLWPNFEFEYFGFNSEFSYLRYS